MKGRTVRRQVRVSGDGAGVVSLAGAFTLVETARVSGLDAALSDALAPWQLPRAMHDPGKEILDLAIALAVGGDCPADVATLRGQPALFGAVASDPTICRLVDRLAEHVETALPALRAARAAARARVWHLGGGPDLDAAAVVVDGDGTLVVAHSDKDGAAPTYKRTFGFHPLLAYVDHGQTGTGEPLAIMLRPGNAHPYTVADQIQLVELALAQLPATVDPHRVLYRADTAGCSHRLLGWLAERGISFSVGYPAADNIPAALAALPRQAWRRATEGDGGTRDGAWVAELTRHLDLSSWPAGMRIIARKERPHPGAQLRLTDIDGHRITLFATNTAGRITDLELRHRRRARAEDRIRAAKDTGLRNLPYRDFARNQIWCEIIAIAQDLTAWLQTLALDEAHAVAEPKRLRLHLFTVAGHLVRTSRRLRLRLARSWRWTPDVVTAVTTLQALPRPG